MPAPRSELTARSRFSAWQSMIVSAAPSRPNAPAIAYPIPHAPPVMNACLPSNCMDMADPFQRRGPGGRARGAATFFFYMAGGRTPHTPDGHARGEALSEYARGDDHAEHGYEVIRQAGLRGIKPRQHREEHDHR